MEDLVILVDDTEYTLTGYRRLDDNCYWYETTTDIWLNGSDIRFKNELSNNR